MQISPVVPTGTREEIVHASLSSLALWPKFKTLTLKKNMCLSFDGLDDNKKKNFVNLLSGFFQLGMEKYLTSHS
jgi:hypothetical protein